MGNKKYMIINLKKDMKINITIKNNTIKFSSAHGNIHNIVTWYLQKQEILVLKTEADRRFFIFIYILYIKGKLSGIKVSDIVFFNNIIEKMRMIKNNL